MPRAYDNSRRRAQAEQTRSRILTAAADLVAEGRSLDISLPAVSRRAGVSEPTLFRYFSSKQHLFSALADMEARTVTEGIAPSTVAEVRAALPTVFARADDIEPLIRWTLAAGLAGGMPRTPRADRTGMVRRVLDATGADDPEVRIHLERLLLLLTSPLVAFYWRDYLALDSEEAALTAAWAIDRLTQDAGG
jgi:AcrR family transcriptional regulator